MNMPKNLSLQQFESFLAVAESGSFTQAAQKLHITKAALSTAIKKLETALEISLFIRSTRSLTLTEEGKSLLAQCQRLQQELNAARDLIGHFKKEPTGLLRISCNPYLAESHLLHLITQYLARFPKMAIDIMLEERMPNMQQEQIDLVFGINWPAPDDVVAKVIGKTRYVLCASPQYLAQYGTPTTLQDLKNHRYIPHTSRATETPIMTLKHPLSIPLQQPLKMNNAHFMKTCALAGLGIIQLHDYMLEPELTRGQLIEILPETVQTHIPVYLYYYKHRFTQPKIRQFLLLLNKT